MKTIAILVLVLAVVAGPCTACSPPMNWESQGFIRRMEQTPVVFSGKVTKLHNHPGEGRWGIYQATFDVDCVYKSGAGGTVSKTVQVSGFGYDGGRCTSDEVQEGETYFVFADASYGEGLHLDPVNIQAAATEASPRLIARVETSYNCNQPGV